MEEQVNFGPLPHAWNFNTPAPTLITFTLNIGNPIDDPPEAFRCEEVYYFFTRRPLVPVVNRWRNPWRRRYEQLEKIYQNSRPYLGGSRLGEMLFSNDMISQTMLLYPEFPVHAINELGDYFRLEGEQRSWAVYQLEDMLRFKVGIIIPSEYFPKQDPDIRPWAVIRRSCPLQVIDGRTIELPLLELPEQPSDDELPPAFDAFQ